MWVGKSTIEIYKLDSSEQFERIFLLNDYFYRFNIFRWKYCVIQAFRKKQWGALYFLFNWIIGKKHFLQSLYREIITEFISE